MDTSIIKTKQKVMLLSSAFSFIVVIVFIFLEYFAYQEEFKNEVKKLNKNVLSSYSYETKALQNFYNTRIKCNLRDDDVLNAFEQKDASKLYSVIEDRFEALKQENKYLKIMHFHSIDNKSILRVHNPRNYGDDLSSFRAIVTNTNQFLKNNFGLESGIYGMYFRTVNPVFNRFNEHIGSMEFGVESKYVLNKLKQYYPDDKYALLINEKHLSKNKSEDHLLFWKGNYLLEDNESFFRKIYKTIDMTKPYALIREGEKLYIVTYSTKIKDYLEEDMGILFAATDVTSLENKFYLQMLHTILLVMILLFSFLIMLNYGFGKYIEKLAKTTKDLQENMIEIEKDKKLLEKYTISSQTDLKGNITHVSEAFCEISGYTKKELIGNSHNIVRHEDMPHELYEEMWSLIKAGQYWEGEIKNKRKDGSSYWVKSYITPKYNINKKIVGYSAVRQDITIQKSLERK